MAEYKLGVIGAGNMAEALVRGVIGGQFMQADSIVAADPSVERQKVFADQLGVTCGQDNATAAGCRTVLLAVKPQMMAGVLDGIADAVPDDALVISIAAGVKTSLIDEKLSGKGRIVRVMPNTPMLVGAGVSAVAAGPRAIEDDLAMTEKLFGVCSRTCRVTEQMMDAVTAVSGSGPAYFFYLLEAMIAAGIAEGLEGATAATLAAQTCAGAAKLMIESGEKPEVLRARVTSPGGTTQRAIETMDAAGVKDALVEAIRAAAERSRELGQ